MSKSKTGQHVRFSRQQRVACYELLYYSLFIKQKRFYCSSLSSSEGLDATEPRPEGKILRSLVKK